MLFSLLDPLQLLLTASPVYSLLELSSIILVFISVECIRFAKLVMPDSVLLASRVALGLGMSGYRLFRRASRSGSAH